MTKTRILIVIAAVALLVIGGLAGAYIVDNQANDSAETTSDNTPAEQFEEADTAPEAPAETAPDQPESQVVDGVDIPQSVLDSIAADYPDYTIDDADRETQDGQMFYEIELDHNQPGSDTEYQLTYDAEWSLVGTELDD